MTTRVFHRAPDPGWRDRYGVGRGTQGEDMQQHPINLDGVPETMLWPLWNRAAEMKRTDRLLEDPMAAELVERIDYDFPGQFGKPAAFHVIRARVCDDLTRDYLAREGEQEPVVVALGDGLDTQPWRIGDGRLRWISVDVLESIRVRRELLPPHPHATLVACSALDPAWMDAVPTRTRPLITAAGLLMYFKEEDVRWLLTQIAQRFPGAEVFFDTITPFLSRRSMEGLKVTRRYTIPPMPWGIRINEIPAFVNSIPGLAPITVQTYADPFPQRMRLYKMLSFIQFLRNLLGGCLVHGRVQ